jgi:uncharacterized protein YgiM (DUF1202 family)
MESFLRLTVIVSMAGFVLPAFAAKPAAGEPAHSAAISEATDANLPAMPFMAEMTGDDYVRSGAGTNYYDCGKLKKGDKVKVVGSRYSWLQIVPPPGSFAWISKQYVQVEPAGSATGTVIGEGVRVYAGSNDVQPMHSTSLLVKLNKDDTVALLGEEKDGYYKISPPEGAYLWVSNQSAKPLGSLAAPAGPAPVAPVYTPPPPSFPTTTGQTQADSPQAVTSDEPAAPLSVDAQKTKEVLALKEQVDAERAKPVADQNFVEMKKKVAEMAGDKQAPKAAKNAQNLLKTIERCELAKKVSEAAKSQDEQLIQTQKQIEEAREAKLSQLEDRSIFAVIGQMKESSVFAEAPGVKYYRIVDDQGKMICYARPAGEAANMDLSKFIDKKVGLVGTIEPSAELGGAIVEFTSIVENP